jgi:hypothetical protein
MLALNTLSDSELIHRMPVLRAHERDHRTEAGERNRVVSELAGAVAAWVKVLSYSRQIDPTAYRTKSEVADDVIAGAGRLLQLVTEDAEISDLPVARDTRDALEPLLERARAERDDADKVAGDLQVLAREVNDLALRVQAALKRLRSLLRAHVGVQHVDYRYLRVRRRRGDFDDDDDDEDDAIEAADPDSEAPLASSVSNGAPDRPVDAVA